MRQHRRAAIRDRLTLPAICAAAALALTLTPAVSSAAVKKVRPWQKYVSADCTGTSSGCSAQLAEIGKKRRLEITHVSCFVGVNNTGTPLYVRIRNMRKSGGSEYDHYVPVPTDSNLVGQYSAVNDQTRLVAKAGDVLAIQTGAENDILSLACKATGDLTVFE